MKRLYNRDENNEERKELENTIEKEFSNMLKPIFEKYSFIEPYDLMTACIGELTVITACTSINIKKKIN